jgi:hypothetical protein
VLRVDVGSCRANETDRGIEVMAKRKPRRAAAAGKPPESTAGLQQALSRRTKAELVAVLLELAEADRRILRQLTNRFDVGARTDERVAATRQAIADATDFDPRDINRNFAYDYGAYAAVKRNLGRLIGAGKLPVAMELALELMQRGSHQVEMSDEGMMTEDSEDCLGVVFDALAKCKLTAEEVLAWCKAMQDSDRVGFIARARLRSLQAQAEEAAAR